MDAVNIRGLNSVEWVVSFLGCMAAGGLPVGLYPTDSEEALQFKAKDSGAKFIMLGKLNDVQLYSRFLGRPEFKSVKWVVMWQGNRQFPEEIDKDTKQAL